MFRPDGRKIISLFGGVFLTVPRKKIKKEEGKERKKEKGETPIP